MNERITKAEVRACLSAMDRIANGEHATKVIEAMGQPRRAGVALEKLGWMTRGERTYFGYVRGRRRDGLWEYRPDQVLVALAMCLAVSEYGVGTEKENSNGL